MVVTEVRKITFLVQSSSIRRQKTKTFDGYELAPRYVLLKDIYYIGFALNGSSSILLDFWNPTSKIEDSENSFHAQVKNADSKIMRE